MVSASASTVRNSGLIDGETDKVSAVYVGTLVIHWSLHHWVGQAHS